MRLGWVLLVLVAACTPVAERGVDSPAGTAGSSGVTGEVTAGGEPAAGAWVYAYRSARGGLRGPADFGTRVDAQGDYLLELPPGRYHLVARDRRGGEASGPPRPGDAWALYPRNPVSVRAGFTERADFALQKVAQPMLMRQGTLTAGDTGFTGRIVDRQGRPVPGAFALAYRDGDFRRMPDFTSPAVGEDGAFTLYVTEPGTYCLAARTRTRGQPRPGELYGLLAEKGRECREIEKGRVEAVGEIVVTPYRR